MTEIEVSLLDPETGQRELRRFSSIGSYGYIWDTTHQPGTLGSQVCDELAGGGSTLTCRPDDEDDLRRVIRREQRRRLRARRRWEARR